MKSISDVLASGNTTRAGRLFLMFVLVPILFIFGNSSMAQNEPGTTNSNNPQKAEPNLKKYLTDKHPKIEEVVSSLHQTPHGPKGSLHIIGKFLPKNAPVSGGDRESRSRAIAKAFLEEEAILLGITNMDEMKEFSVYSNKGHDGDLTHLYYRRYINGLELDGEDIHIKIGPDETIDYVGAALVPAPKELYDAAVKDQLSEEKIREIITQDMMSTRKLKAYDVKIKHITKIAVSTSPYVIWKARVHLRKGPGGWEYKINAITGEILTRGSIEIE